MRRLEGLPSRVEEDRFLFGREAGDGWGGDMPDGELALGGDAMAAVEEWRPVFSGNDAASKYSAGLVL